jgi:hypothetical protein
MDALLVSLMSVVLVGVFGLIGTMVIVARKQGAERVERSQQAQCPLHSHLDNKVQALASEITDIKIHCSSMDGHMKQMDNKLSSVDSKMDIIMRNGSHG